MADIPDADLVRDDGREEQRGGNGEGIPVGENGSEDLEEGRAPQGYQHHADLPLSHLSPIRNELSRVLGLWSTICKETLSSWNYHNLRSKG